MDTRSIDSIIWQKSSVILALKTDIDKAHKLGEIAWRYATTGYTGVMSSMKRDISIDHYHIFYEGVPIKKKVRKERYVPKK